MRSGSAKVCSLFFETATFMDPETQTGAAVAFTDFFCSSVHHGRELCEHNRSLK